MGSCIRPLWPRGILSPRRSPCPARPTEHARARRQRRRPPRRRPHPRSYAPVLRLQGGASGRAAVLPHGRLLRAVSTTDARKAARLLDITLTQRGASRGSRSRCAACRITPPIYLARLVALGESVAICEQIGDPASRRASSNARSSASSPGHRHRRGAARPARDTLLLAISRGRNGWGLAWADLAAGRFLCNEVAKRDALEAESPGWTPPRCCARTRIPSRLHRLAHRLRRRAPWLFDVDGGRRHLLRFFAVHDLSASGHDDRPRRCRSGRTARLCRGDAEAATAASHFDRRSNPATAPSR